MSSATILAELEYHEARKQIRRGTSPEQARRRAVSLIAAMRTAIDDAEAGGWEPLEGSHGLPDPDDEHVLAAAVVAGTTVTVTHNLKDFPRECVPEPIDVQSPVTLAYNTVCLGPTAAVRAIQAIAARKRTTRPAPRRAIHPQYPSREVRAHWRRRHSPH